MAPVAERTTHVQPLPAFMSIPDVILAPVACTADAGRSDPRDSSPAATLVALHCQLTR